MLVATRHNEGKTLLALGLARAYARKGLKVGYFKPIGQGNLEGVDSREDADAVLMKEAAGVPGTTGEIAPVLLQGFPTDWATREGHESVLERIRKAHAKIAAGRDIVLVEATGNAAAGAGFGLSNAFLARILGAKVVLMASGGVGQPTDEVILNKSYLERTGIGVAGVVINKTYPHETERLESFMKRVLQTLNVTMLGTIPYDSELSKPHLRNLVEEFRGLPIAGEERFLRPTGRFVFGAMSPRAAVDQFKGKVTLICPVDREDMLATAFAVARRRPRSFELVSIVLAGMEAPSSRVLEAVKRTGMPTVHVQIDAYSLAFLIHSTRYKLLASDQDRVRRAEELVAKHVDADGILERLDR